MTDIKRFKAAAVGLEYVGYDYFYLTDAEEKNAEPGVYVKEEDHNKELDSSSASKDKQIEEFRELYNIATANYLERDAIAHDLVTFIRRLVRESGERSPIALAALKYIEQSGYGDSTVTRVDCVSPSDWVEVNADVILSPSQVVHLLDGYRIPF